MKVLDHGYVELVETWGSDERIIEAARMSTDGGFRGWDTDARLLKYLWEHKHATPFEMAGMVIEVQAPIFVIREWQRHRTAVILNEESFAADMSFNEMSGRYVELPDLCYVPSVERLMAGKQSTANKQGSEVGFAEVDAIYARQHIIDAQVSARERYEALLKEGVSRELARLVLPVSQYSKMRVSANLRNWLAFLSLRLDGAAQWEIRSYATAVGLQIANTFPRTWDLFSREV